MKFKDELRNLQEAYEYVIKEKTDMKWLGDNVVGKMYKGMEIVNAVFDDKEDKMVKFWIRDPKTKKLKEIRPIPRDELVKVLK